MDKHLVPERAIAVREREYKALLKVVNEVGRFVNASSTELATVALKRMELAFRDYLAKKESKK